MMAIWWATEAIPIPATSLLPLVILPLLSGPDPLASDPDAARTVLRASDIAVGYAHPIVLLLLGGFIIAMGIERWGLHKRIALNVISRVGSHPAALIAGFMAATAVLSMWISNTATTIMMVPIALSAAAALGDESGRFVTALLLGVCYAASISGVATPIGTPTNLIAINFIAEESGRSIGFLEWMMFGVPSMLLLLPVAWWSVTRGLPRFSGETSAIQEVHRQRAALGKITTPEARAAMVFGARRFALGDAVMVCASARQFGVWSACRLQRVACGYDDCDARGGFDVSYPCGKKGRSRTSHLV